MLARFFAKENAIKKIKSQPASTRGQWFVYDTVEEKIVYPVRITGRQRKPKVQKAIDWVKAVIRDSRHGYSCGGKLSSSNLGLNNSRWGRYGDYSCSTLAVMMYDLSGFSDIRGTAGRKKMSFVQLSSKPRGGERFYGLSSVNLGAVLKATGRFKDVSASLRRSGRSALYPGDLLQPRNRGHVAIYLGDGLIAEGSSNERGSEYLSRSKPGDQTGRELRIRNYPGGYYYAYRPEF